jgi:hypothetical protein
MAGNRAALMAKALVAKAARASREKIDSAGFPNDGGIE